jgi:hypothetical protein
MPIHAIEDFSAGIFYKHKDAQIPKNGVKDAKNIYWDNGTLKAVPGVRYEGKTDLSASPVLVIAGIWYDTDKAIIYGRIGAGDRQFYQMDEPASPYAGSTFDCTAIDAAVISTGTACHFVRFSDDLIVAHMTDTGDLFVLDKSSGSWAASTLDVYDTQQRDDVQWYAGNYDATGPAWTDDTTDAQDAGANDFDPCPSAVNGDGFYVAGVVRFNKVILKTLSSGLVDAASVTYMYYATDGTWKNVSMVTTPTWTGSGDKTIEFDIPTDWGVWDGADASGGAEGCMAGRYIFRVIFGSITTTDQADTVEVYHTQRVTEVTGGATIEAIGVHDNRLYIGAGNQVNYSPYAQLTKWTDYEKEYCSEGGDTINAFKSFRGAMYVFKNRAMYEITGSSYEDLKVDKVADVGTPMEGDAIPVVRDKLLFFWDTAAYLNVFDGQAVEVISSPIQRAIREDTAKGNYPDSATYMRFWLDRVWSNYPDNYDVLFDPDSLRLVNEKNDKTYIASFWRWSMLGLNTAGMSSPFLEHEKYNPQKVYYFYDEYIYSLNRLSVSDDAPGGNPTESANEVILQTKKIDCEHPQRKKVFKRLKIAGRFAPEVSVIFKTDDDSDRETSFFLASFYYIVGRATDSTLEIDQVSAADIAKCKTSDTLLPRNDALDISFFFAGTPILDVQSASIFMEEDGYLSTAKNSKTSYTFWFATELYDCEKSIPYGQDGYGLELKFEFKFNSNTRTGGIPNATQLLMAPIEISGLYIDYQLKRF